jgi:hypothetical protein
MIGLIEHFFAIPVTYSAIANLHNSLEHAPFSSLYSQLLLASEFAPLTRTLHRPKGNTVCIVDKTCLPRLCLAMDSLLLSLTAAGRLLPSCYPAMGIHLTIYLYEFKSEYIGLFTS